jgi:hypothetical protein
MTLALVGLVALTLTDASLSPSQLTVKAEHAGGFSFGVTWTLTIDDRRIGVFASEPRYKRTFEVTDAAKESLASIIDEADFFALQPKYGIGHAESNICRMTVSYKGRQKTVTLVAYSKRKPPSETEAAEVQRAYRVWDALKSIAGLSELADDCRRELDIW